jgi:hypothetical protein
MKHFLLLVSFALVAILGCESETPTANNNDSNDTGTVIGFMQTATIFGGLNPDQSGTKITLEGTSFSTVTDSTGRWILSGIPSGSYSGIITRDKYITKTLYNVHVFPKGVNYYDNYYDYSYYIYPVPDFLEATGLVLRPFEDHQENSWRDSTYTDSLGNLRHTYVNDTTRYPLGITKFTVSVRMSKVTSDTNSANVRGTIFAYFSKSKDINPIQHSTNLLELPQRSDVSFFEDQDTPYDYFVLRKDLINSGFKSGDTIYTSVYASPNYTNRYQYNPFDRSYINYYLSVHSTPVYSFVLP